MDKLEITIGKPLNEPVEDIYLIQISMDEIAFPIRLKYIPWLLTQLWKNIPKLKAEFLDWKKNQPWFTLPIQVLFIVDHFILWPFYVALCTLVGDTISGFHREDDRWRWLKFSIIDKKK